MTPLAMQPATIAALATIGAGLISGIFGYIAVRGSNRTKRLEAQVTAQGQNADRMLGAQQTSYDQLQEDVTGFRGEIAVMKKAHSDEIAALRSDHSKEMAVLRADLAKSIRRERAVEKYAWDLRRYIQRGEGPPPPDWPPELEQG